MSPIIPLTPNGSNTVSGGLQCSVFLGFTGSEDIMCSEKESNVGGKVAVHAENEGEVNEETDTATSSEREDSDSPSLIQNGAVTQMGFANDDDAVFINNKSINMLERMSSQEKFKSVLSINLDDIEKETVTPGGF